MFEEKAASLCYRKSFYIHKTFSMMIFLFNSSLWCFQFCGSLASQLYLSYPSNNSIWTAVLLPHHCVKSECMSNVTLVFSAALPICHLQHIMEAADADLLNVPRCHVWQHFMGLWYYISSFHQESHILMNLNTEWHFNFFCLNNYHHYKGKRVKKREEIKFLSVLNLLWIEQDVLVS